LLADIRSRCNCAETLRVAHIRRRKIPQARPLLATRAKRSRGHVTKQLGDRRHIVRALDQLALVRLNRRRMHHLLLIL
jgi:hypothetical protein